MYISDYIDSIASGLSFDHDYIEAFIDDAQENELNLKLETVTGDTVLALLNIGTYVQKVSKTYQITEQSYNLVFRLMEKQEYLDDESQTIDTDIITSLEAKVNEIQKAILTSSAYQDVTNQDESINITTSYFKANYDNIMAGVQFVMPVRLYLAIPFC